MLNKVLLNPILVLVFIFINCSSFAQNLQSEQSFKIKADSLLKYFYDNNKLMGSVTISKAGKVVYEKALGYSHIAVHEKKSETIDTRYRIGSISKMFTAVIIFQLIDEKKLSLEVTLSKFFPGIPGADSITIGNMLNHHSGLYNFTNDSEYAAYHTSPKTEDEMVKIFESHKPEFNPGEKGAYSNTNYVLLSYIIERITGGSYASQLKKRIIDKIGLDNTYYGHKININNNEASSYTMEDDKWVESKESDMSIQSGSGGIVSNTGDLVKFTYALFTGKLISPESLKSMLTFKDNFGRGIFELAFYKHNGYGHTGGIDGFASNVGYFPEDSLAIAFCTNAMNYSMNEIYTALLSSYYNKPYTPPSFKTIAVPVKQLKKYEGLYYSIVLNTKVTVKLKGKVLTVQPANQSPFPLSAMSETQFRYDPAGILIDFTLPKEGAINEFYLKQGRGRFLFTRMP